MKSIIKLVLVVTVALVYTSCTEVIDVDVSEAEPRLVIEASLDWQEGTLGNEQVIKLSMSTPYFSDIQEVPVSGAQVMVINNTTAEQYVFTDQNDGTYYTNTFEPVEGQAFTLTVTYDGETYEGTETFLKEVSLFIEGQSVDGGFDDEAIEINTYYQDDPDEVNYYLWKYHRQGDNYPYLETDWDEFTNGNLRDDFFEIDEDEDSEQGPLAAGDVVDIYLYNISESYFNFMNIMLNQAESGGNPFATTPAALQGNCKNTGTGDDAYGYFRTTRVSKVTYTVQ